MIHLLLRLISQHRSRLAALLLFGFGLFYGSTQRIPDLAYSADFSGILDVSENGVINLGDAQLVISSWASLQPQTCDISEPLQGRDIDGDGCIGVADVQTILAHLGTASEGHQGEMGVAMLDSTAQVDFVVTSARDEGDANLEDDVCATASGPCTLRSAIEQASNRPGPETIQFNIRNQNGSCPTLVTIETARPLVIDDAGDAGVVIDGYSQCEASPATSDADADIRVEVKGNSTEGIYGIEILSSNNVVRGLAIYNFDRQIQIVSSNNRIEGNFLGTDVTNTFTAAKASTHHGEGIRIEGNHSPAGAEPSNNVIGGITPAARNIISGNGTDGVGINGAAHENRVIGNYIGLKQDGRTGLRNASDGLDFNQGAHHNWLGGTEPGERNIIAGNWSDGIEISHDPESRENHVVGNYFGLDASGTVTVPNYTNGVSLEDRVESNYVYQNVIGGNGANGVRFYVLATNNEVYDNLIGTAADGVTPMPNGTYPPSGRGRSGIYAMGGSKYNVIRNNVIANNPENGVRLSNTSDGVHNGFDETFYNTISRNRIYNNGLEPGDNPKHALPILLDWKENPETGRRVYANQGLPAPYLAAATTTSVTGYAVLPDGITPCEGCLIELFIAADSMEHTCRAANRNGAATFVASATTSTDGYFAIRIAQGVPGRVFTATSTDPSGNTSQFSHNLIRGCTDLYLPVLRVTR